MDNKFYQLDKHSKTGKLLAQFWHRAQKAAQRADGYAGGMGAVSYIPPVQYFEGGVDFLEFDHEPDVNIWRKKELGDCVVYEPNCDARSGVLVLPEANFRPSDTWNMLYNKERYKWSGVRDKHPLAYWLKITGVKPSGNDEKDWQTLDAQLASKTFVTFVEFCGGALQPNSKSKASMAFRKAVKAEKLRMSLPVVDTSELFVILGYQWPSGKKQLKELSRKLSTPTFFFLGDDAFVCIQGECRAEGLTEIDGRLFEFKKNIALNAKEISQ